MSDEMNGLFSMNGGMPPGVSRPRRRPAMWFDGVNDYVRCGDVPLAGRTTLSISGQLVLNTYNKPHYFFDKRVSAALYFIIYTDLNNLFIRFRVTTNNHGYCALSLLELYRRHYWSVRYNGAGISNADKLQLFLDGEQVSLSYTGTIPATIPNFDGFPITLGYPSPATLQGMQREIAIHNRLLSEAEIGHLQRDRGMPTDGLLAYWKGDGITDDNWRDLSGNGYHGTVYGSPERCLVHVRGAVIRTDPGTGERYIVR